MKPHWIVTEIVVPTEGQKWGMYVTLPLKECVFLYANLSNLQTKEHQFH